MREGGVQVHAGPQEYPCLVGAGIPEKHDVLEREGEGEREREGEGDHGREGVVGGEVERYVRIFSDFLAMYCNGWYGVGSDPGILEGEYLGVSSFDSVGVKGVESVSLEGGGGERESSSFN